MTMWTSQLVKVGVPPVVLSNKMVELDTQYHRYRIPGTNRRVRIRVRIRHDVIVHHNAKFIVDPSAVIIDVLPRGAGKEVRRLRLGALHYRVWDRDQLSTVYARSWARHDAAALAAEASCSTKPETVPDGGEGGRGMCT